MEILEVKHVSRGRPDIVENLTWLLSLGLDHLLTTCSPGSSCSCLLRLSSGTRLTFLHPDGRLVATLHQEQIVALQDALDNRVVERWPMSETETKLLIVY